MSRAIDEFMTPRIIELNNNGLASYAIMVVELWPCSICGKMMVQKSANEGYYHATAFPTWIEMTFKKQVERAGFALVSPVRQDGGRVCQECEQGNKVSFFCAFCGERKSSSRLQESFGDTEGSAEYLCRDCYASVPAEKWDAKSEELHNIHKYDFD